MYRFQSGCVAGDTVRSGRLKPWTSLLEAADRLIFGAGVFTAALFIGYLTRYRVPALTVKRGSKGYAFERSRLTSGGRGGADATIRYEKHERNKIQRGQEFRRRERANKSNC